MAEIICFADSSVTDAELLRTGAYERVGRLLHSLSDYVAVRLGPELDDEFRVPGISVLEGHEIPFLMQGKGSTFLNHFPKTLLLDAEGKPKIEAQKHIWLYRNLMKVAVTGLFSSLLGGPLDTEFSLTRENWAERSLYFIDLERAESEEGLEYKQVELITTGVAAGIIESGLLREEKRIAFKGYGLTLRTVKE